MRIAHFTDTFSQRNGVSSYIHNISELMSKKHDVTIYTGSGKGNGYKVVNYPRITFPLETSYEVVFPKRFDVKADVVHCHTPYFVGFWGLQTGLPSVTNTHTAPRNMFSMFGANFLEPIGWWHISRFHNSSDFVITGRKSTAELFRKHGVKKPIKVISLGVDTRFFQKADADRAFNKFHLPERFVLSIGRLSVEKRSEYVLKACRELRLTAVLTSTGPLMDRLRRDYPEARFLGNVSEQDKADLMKAASVFAFPTMTETEGLVLLEALAAGVPTLSTNLPVLREIIKDGDNGMLFNSYDDFKKKLYTLTRDSSISKKISNSGLKTAKQHDLSITVSELLKLYKSL